MKHDIEYIGCKQFSMPVSNQKQSSIHSKLCNYMHFTFKSKFKWFLKKISCIKVSRYVFSMETLSHMYASKVFNLKKVEAEHSFLGGGGGFI